MGRNPQVAGRHAALLPARISASPWSFIRPGRRAAGAWFSDHPALFYGLEMFRGVKVMLYSFLGSRWDSDFTVQGFHEGRGRWGSQGQWYISAALFRAHCPPPSSFPLQLPQNRSRLFCPTCAVFLRRPLTLGDTPLAWEHFPFLAAGIYITRTGHVMEITPAETILRQGLEQLLGVRPRFKECLLGYPLGLLGAYLLGGSSRRALKRLAALFPGCSHHGPYFRSEYLCPYHRAPDLSLLRSIHSFWLGCLAGFLLIYFWRKIALLFFRKTDHLN